MKILITGTSTPSGIGQSLVRYFGERGHEIWGLARTPHDAFAEECRSRNIAFRYTCCDIAIWDQVLALRNLMDKEWQRLDAMICCAGIQGPLGDTMRLDPAAWTESIQINLTGTFFCLRAFFDLLRRAPRRAKIVCFSGGGSTGPRVHFSPYAIAKTGIVRLVENLAHEWKDLPVDINALAPGAVNTRMTREVLNLGAAVVGDREFQIASQQWAQGATPVDQYAPCLEFLLSARSDGISGRLISSKWDPWNHLDQYQSELAASEVFTLRRIVPGDRKKEWHG